MKKILAVFILLFTIANCENIREVNTYKEAIIKGKKENKKVLMFVYMDYCPWCDKMKQNTFRDTKVIKLVNENYIFVKVNKDTDRFPSSFQPRFIPTTYLIDPKTKDEEYALYGYKSADQFINELADDEEE